MYLYIYVFLCQSHWNSTVHFIINHLQIINVIFYVALLNPETITMLKVTSVKVTVSVKRPLLTQ